MTTDQERLEQIALALVIAALADVPTEGELT